MVRKKQSSTPSSTTSDLSDDPDTEEALKGFDFLASPDELDGSADRSGEDSGEWGERKTFTRQRDLRFFQQTKTNSEGTRRRRRL